VKGGAVNQARVDQTQCRKALRCAEDSRPTAGCFTQSGALEGTVADKRQGKHETDCPRQLHR
jgi:hypothetical protein